MSGTQNYLELEGKSLRLKAFKTAIDGAHAAAGFTITIVLWLLIAAFAGTSVSLALSLVMPAPLAFLVTAFIFGVVLVIFRRYYHSGAAARDEFTRRITTGEMRSYEQLLYSTKQVQEEVLRSREALNTHLQSLREKTEKLESMFGRGADPGTFGSVARSFAGPAARFVLENLLMPKAGLIKRAVLPAVAGLVMNGGARSLISKLFRKRGSARPGKSDDLT